MNEIQKLLATAKSKIEDPANWCREAFALTEAGESITSTSNRACQWCALGALRASLHHEPNSDGNGIYDTTTGNVYKNARAILNEVAGKLATEWNEGIHSIVTINDDLGHSAVMKVYDAAIEEAGKL